MAEALARPANWMTGWLAAIGRATRLVLQHAGAMGHLLAAVVSSIVRMKVSPREVVQQMYVMGIQSLPIALVTASLAGIVTSQQGGYQFQGNVPLYVLGSLVVETMVLEMGPVLTGIVLVGRVGARITAELGSMVVTEQIDAYQSLGRDPVAILVAPRVIAGTLVTPLLVAIADVVGIPMSTLSRTVSESNNAAFWKTYPTMSRACWSAVGPPKKTDCPPTHTSPRSGSINPSVVLSSTLLPVPEGPKSAKSSPSSTLSVTPASTGTSNAFQMSRYMIIEPSLNGFPLYCSMRGGKSASRIRTVRVMNITAAVVWRPTPDAPPPVRSPMWVEMIGIANPNASAFVSE